MTVEPTPNRGWEFKFDDEWVQLRFSWRSVRGVHLLGTADHPRCRAKVSGSLLDHIDILVAVPAVRYKELAEQSIGESSATIHASPNPFFVRS